MVLSGSEPVGFLIVSHRALVRQRAILKDKYPEIFEKISCESEDEMLAEPMDPDLPERIDRLTE